MRPNIRVERIIFKIRILFYKYFLLIIDNELLISGMTSDEHTRRSAKFCARRSRSLSAKSKRSALTFSRRSSAEPLLSVKSAKFMSWRVFFKLFHSLGHILKKKFFLTSLIMSITLSPAVCDITGFIVIVTFLLFHCFTGNTLGLK